MMADDPIKHVIVLCLENRSFDQMLGCFKEKFPDLDGIDPAAPQTCLDDQGNAYTQRATTLRQMPNDKTHLWDPHHEVEHVHMQIEGDPDHPAQMKGFVFNFAKAYPDSTRQTRQHIMDYYPRRFLPGLHSLAEDFTICDRWFSSLPGPTWPNRFFALSGTASGRVAMPGDGTHHADLPGFFEQNQETIFDRLNEQRGALFLHPRVLPRCARTRGGVSAVLLYRAGLHGLPAERRSFAARRDEGREADR